MITIKNKLRQRIPVELKGGKRITLLSGGSAKVSNEDINLSGLKKCIERSEIVVVISKTEIKTEEKEEVNKKEKPVVQKTADKTKIKKEVGNG